MAKKRWLQTAIKHPGAEKKAAAAAGMSTHGYMEKHEHDSEKSGDRARLGLRLEKGTGKKKSSKKMMKKMYRGGK